MFSIMFSSRFAIFSALDCLAQSINRRDRQSMVGPSSGFRSVPVTYSNGPIRARRRDVDVGIEKGLCVCVYAVFNVRSKKKKIFYKT